MSEGANESAEALLAGLNKDGDQTLAEVLVDPPKAEPEKPAFVLMYIVRDKITAESNDPTKQNVSVLEGRISAFDLAAAGVDKEWLLRSGAIVEDGYEPTS